MALLRLWSFGQANSARIFCSSSFSREVVTDGFANFADLFNSNYYLHFKSTTYMSIRHASLLSLKQVSMLISPFISLSLQVRAFHQSLQIKQLHPQRDPYSGNGMYL